MKRAVVVLLVLVFALGLMVSSAQAQTTVAEEETVQAEPQFVVETVYDAVEAGDIDAALELLADDAVLTVLPAPDGQEDAAFVGKDEIRTWYEGLHADNPHTEFHDVTVTGNRATWKAEWWGDFFRSIDLAPAQFEGVAVIQDGKVSSMIWANTPEYVERMNQRMAILANKQLAEEYMKAWEQADLQVLDEVIADDFVNHSPPLPEDKEGMKQFAADDRAASPEGFYTVEQMVAEDDLVFLHGYKQIDAENGFYWSTLLRMADGKLVERWGTASE